MSLTLILMLSLTLVTTVLIQATISQNEDARVKQFELENTVADLQGFLDEAGLKSPR